MSDFTQQLLVQTFGDQDALCRIMPKKKDLSENRLCAPVSYAFSDFSVLNLYEIADWCLLGGGSPKFQCLQRGYFGGSSHLPAGQ